MEWFLIALIAPMFWAVLNIIDKYFLTKWVKNPVSYQILCLLFDSLAILPIFLLVKISFVYPWYILGIVSNTIVGLAFLLYNKAMMLEEASRVVIMFYINPLFVLIIAFIFLGEVLDINKYIGIILLVLSAILISYEKSKRRFRLSKPLIFILINSIIWAAYEVFAKHALGYIDYYSFLFWGVIGNLISGLLLLCFTKFRKDFTSDISKTDKKKIFFWRIFSVILYFIAILSFYIAISKESVSLVAAIPSTQPMFVFIYSLFLSLFIPHIVKEKVSRMTILLKILSIILIFFGTWLIVS